MSFFSLPFVNELSCCVCNLVRGGELLLVRLYSLLAASGGSLLLGLAAHSFVLSAVSIRFRCCFLCAFIAPLSVGLYVFVAPCSPLVSSLVVR